MNTVPLVRETAERTNAVDSTSRPRNSKVLRSRLFLFLICSAILALSFFFRHVAGFIVTDGAYNPLVYNPISIRVIPPPQYDFLPDDALWDETRAYARSTQGFLRHEIYGPVFSSYAPYVSGPMPASRNFFRDGLGQLVLSWMARVPGSSVRAAFCAADLLYVFGLAFAFMLYAYELYPSALFAVTGTAVVLCFNWHDWLNLLKYLHGEPQNSSMMLRTPYPQLSLLVFVLFLLFIKRLVEHPSARGAVALVLTFVLNFYCYFYSWTLACVSLFAVMGVLALSLKTRRNLFEQDRETSKKALWCLFGSGAATMILTFPVWAAVLRNTPEVADSFVRLQGNFTHLPYVSYAVGMPALLILALWARSRKFQVSWITIPFLIAGLVVMNLQVVLGKTLQPNHWSAYYIQPIILLAMLQLAWPFLERLRPKVLNVVSVLVIAAAIGQNMTKFWTGALESRGFNQKDPAFEQLISRLEGNDLGGFGFVTNDQYLQNVLPAYVRQKLLAPSYLDQVSDVELWQLRLAAIKAAGFDDWTAFSRASGQGGTPVIDETVIRYDVSKVLLVMNRHRDIPSAAWAGRCELLSNPDFLVLKPCTH